MEKNTEKICLDRMHFLIQRGRCKSKRQAAALVAVAFGFAARRSRRWSSAGNRIWGNALLTMVFF